MRYSTFASVDNVKSTLVDEPWERIVERLTRHTITPDKTDVGLFNGTVFGGSGRRMLSTAEEVAFVIFDVDNSVPKGHPDYEVGVKKRLPNPMQTYEAEALLSGFEFVLVTSHSHTVEWPRFRLVLPLKTPVAAAMWKPFASTLLATLGLSEWHWHIDGIFMNPSQAYYWPSCPPHAPHDAVHSPGRWLEFNPLAMPVEGGTAFSVGARKTDGGVSPFTSEQVAAFWAHELPEMHQETFNGIDWRHQCPLHGGHNQKFYVNPKTGKWYCQSKCVEPDKGGDIYKYVMLRHSKRFPEAKQYVHEIIGDPTAEHTPEQLTEAIGTSDLEDVSTLVEAIAKQPKKTQTPLVQQLVTTHQLDHDLIKEQVAAHSKIVSFNKAGVRPPEPTEPNSYGLIVSPERYEMSERGIHQMRWVSNGQRGPVLERLDPPLADRPIWPGAIGVDLATDTHYVQLAWRGSQGTHHQHWLPENIIRSRDALLKLDDAPISLASLVGVSAWLAYAKTCIVTPTQTLATQASWYGEEGAMRFILPSDETVEYIGPDMAVRGNLDGWCIGLQEILSLGEGAYPALVALGLSAASPLVRFIRKRNPVVAIVAGSSKGKNKVIEYALSIWDEARKYRIPAESTTKGTQDLMKEYPDFPIFIDELQQLNKKDPYAVENMLYFAGDGQRRVTSSKTQKSVGGERRYGVSFLAAEHDVFQAIQQGAQNRVVALEGNPLPEGCAPQVLKIEYATNHNCGVVGRAIVQMLNEGYLPVLAEVEANSWALAETGRLRGDDPYTISLMAAGLRILQDVTGIHIPDEKVHDWLVERLAVTRAASKDTSEDAFVYLLEAILSMPWEQAGNKDVLEDVDGAIAWRGTQVMNPDLTPLEINPTHPKVVELLRRKNQREAVASQWGRKEWVHMNGPNPKRVRSTQGKFHTPGGRAWRITLLGVAKVGLNEKLQPLKGEE